MEIYKKGDHIVRTSTRHWTDVDCSGKQVEVVLGRISAITPRYYEWDFVALISLENPADIYQESTGGGFTTTREVPFIRRATDEEVSNQYKMGG